MPTQTTVYSSNPLIPRYWTGKQAIKLPVTLAASTTFRRGELLVPVAADANCVQTLVIVGSLSAGSFKISGVNPITGNPFTTAAIAYNATVAQVASAVQVALNPVVTGGGGAVAVSTTKTITVTGGGTAFSGVTLTFGGLGAARVVKLMTIDHSGLTGVTASGTEITMTTAGAKAGTFAAYGGGSESAQAILEVACATDASCFVTFGGQAGGDEHGGIARSAYAYFSGAFDIAEIPALDANAISKLGATVKEGSVASGKGWFLF